MIECRDCKTVSCKQCERCHCSPWIYARARLPESKIWCLIVDFRDRIDIREFDPDKVDWKWRDRQGKNYRKRDIVFWMPLPEVPKDEY